MRVAREVCDIEGRRLPAAQTPRVDRLEHRGVAECRQRALALASAPVRYPRIAMVKEHDQLLPRKRTTTRLALVLNDMTDRVALVQHLHRAHPKLDFADRDPRVTLVRQVVKEFRQHTLIATQRANA